jgi:hypothetical protein
MACSYVQNFPPDCWVNRSWRFWAVFWSKQGRSECFQRVLKICLTLTQKVVDIGLIVKKFNAITFVLKTSAEFRWDPDPEANLSSSHKTKTTSFRRWGVVEADEARDFLLKTGIKSDFGPVKPEQSVAKLNQAYAVPSHTLQLCVYIWQPRPAWRRSVRHASYQTMRLKPSLVCCLV